jgi:hypothetical protein
MATDSRYNCRTTDVGALVGPLWFAGWLFTIGFVGLPLGKALLALVVWPYFLGAALK